MILYQVAMLSFSILHVGVASGSPKRGATTEQHGFCYFISFTETPRFIPARPEGPEHYRKPIPWNQRKAMTFLGSGEQSGGGAEAIC